MLDKTGGDRYRIVFPSEAEGEMKVVVEVRCKHCNRKLFEINKLDKPLGNSIIYIKCQRCKKINKIYL